MNKRHTLRPNPVFNAKNILCNSNDILSALAYWAVYQSPYPIPDNLELVLQACITNLEPKFQLRDPKTWLVKLSPNKLGFKRLKNFKKLEEFLSQAILPISYVQLWNERKNGNQAPLGFTSRYDSPEPDNDFIDLDALIRNIAMTITDTHIKIQQNP